MYSVAVQLCSCSFVHSIPRSKGQVHISSILILKWYLRAPWQLSKESKSVETKSDFHTKKTSNIYREQQLFEPLLCSGEYPPEEKKAPDTTLDDKKDDDQVDGPDDEETPDSNAINPDAEEGD